MESKVYFRIKSPLISEEQEIRIIGNLDSVGSWNYHNAKHTERISENIFITPIPISLPISFYIA